MGVWVEGVERGLLGVVGRVRRGVLLKENQMEV